MRYEITRGRWAALALTLLALASCGGSGVGGGSSPPPGPPPSKIFLADTANRAIGSLIDPNPAPGTYAVDRAITGSATGLGTPGGSPSESDIPSIALDVFGDRLYVATQTSALVFDQVGNTSGNAAPSRSLQSVANNHAVNFFGLHITAGDALYAVEPSGEVHVFDNASALDGSVIPDRTIAPNVGSPVTSSFGIAVDATEKNVLYVGVTASSSRIIAFKNADTVNTAQGVTLTPDRTLTFTSAVGSFGLDQDRDILYAAQSDGRILVLDSASTRMDTTPNRTITLPVPVTTSSSTQLRIFVDAANNRLYAVNGTTAFIVNGASIADDAMLGATQITVSSGTGPSLFSAVAVSP
jgi:hypothetical protein